MEGPDIPGPKVWLDLNRKCEAKVIGVIENNKKRSAWLKEYLEECRAKLRAPTPEPTFVPKTPSQPKRGGRRARAGSQSDNDVSHNTTARSTRATRANKRDISQEVVADEQSINSAESYTPPAKKQNNIVTSDKSVVFSAEPVNATYSSQDSQVDETVSSAVDDTASSAIVNETFEVPSNSLTVNNETFEKEPTIDILSSAGEKKEVDENDQFIEAEVVSQPPEDPVQNIVEILKNVRKDDEKMPSPIPAPRAINKDVHNSVENHLDSKSVKSTRTEQEKSNDSVDDSSRSGKNTSQIKESENDISATRSTIPKAANNSSTASTSLEESATSKRSTRTKQKQVEQTSDNVKDASKETSIEEEDSVKPTRSTRTRQRNKPAEEEHVTESAAEPVDIRPVRSTRTKQKQLAQSCSETALTKGTASPRVRELVAQISSPALKQRASPRTVVAGSPVSDRVRVFEQAMRDSAGLKRKNPEKPKDCAPVERAPKKASRTAKRRSSVGEVLKNVSGAQNVSVNDVIAEQEVNVVNPVRKGPIIKKSPGSNSSSNLNNSRAPAGKVVRPGRKVFASGGRGVSPATGPRSGSNTGSSSNLLRSRSRMDIIERNGRITPSKASTPNNLVKNGISSFLPSKPKGPTLEEIQEQKDEERRLKEQREVEARQRREEQMKSKMEEQKMKREERIRRVAEARQKQESQREDKIRRNQEKEKEEKLANLKKREENLKAEADKRKKENEIKLKEAEERRNRDEEERLARLDKIEMERREEERKKEEEQKMRKQKDEDERRKKVKEEERRKRHEEQKREDEKRKLEEEKKRAVTAQQERIMREKEEIRKVKEREEARQAELNSTYNKPSDNTLNKTQTLDQSHAVSSYDMTPARHELPPEPSQDEDNYGLDDLKSDEDTDDEDCPRKQVPKWAEGTQLRTALLKQCYMGPDLDKIFYTVEMPDLSTMFDHQRKRFFKRTSSAVWETPPDSFKHSKRW